MTDDRSESGMDLFKDLRTTLIDQAMDGNIEPLIVLFEKDPNELNRSEIEFLARYMRGNVKLRRGTKKGNASAVLNHQIFMAYRWLMEVEGYERSKTAYGEISRITGISDSSVENRVSNVRLGKNRPKGIGIVALQTFEEFGFDASLANFKNGKITKNELLEIKPKILLTEFPEK